MTNWQKVVKYSAIALAAIIVISIISGITGLLAGLGYIFDEDTDSKNINDYTVKSEIENIDIEIKAARLVVKNSDEFKIKSNTEKIKIIEKNGNLQIIESKRNKLNFSKSHTVEIYIPDSQKFNTVNIDAGAGKAFIEEIEARNIDFKLGAGEFKIMNLSASENSVIQVGFGEIDIKNGKLNNFNLDIGMGEADVKADLSGKSNIECGMGEADLKVIGSKNDYSIDVDKGIGSVKIDGNSVKDGCRIGNGINKIFADCGIGEMNIDFE